MRERFGRTTSLVGAAVLVVSGVNMAAYAGGGHPFLLGRHNTEKHQSVLKNRHKGAALKLKTRKSSPPLKVNSKKKVRHLNADMVDGSSAGALRTSVWRFKLAATATPTHLYRIKLSGLPKGVYQVSYDVELENLKPGFSAETYSECYFLFNGDTVDKAFGISDNEVANTVRELAGSTLLDTRTGAREVEFSCYSAEEATVTARSQVNLIRVDTVHDGSVTVVN